MRYLKIGNKCPKKIKSKCDYLFNSVSDMEIGCHCVECKSKFNIKNNMNFVCFHCPSQIMIEFEEFKLITSIKVAETL